MGKPSPMGLFWLDHCLESPHTKKPIGMVDWNRCWWVDDVSPTVPTINLEKCLRYMVYKQYERFEEKGHSSGKISIHLWPSIFCGKTCPLDVTRRRFLVARCSSLQMMVMHNRVSSRALAKTDTFLGWPSRCKIKWSFNCHLFRVWKIPPKASR